MKCLAPIAVSIRSGAAESFHHGVGIAVDAGEEVAGIGDASMVIYPRSTLKPLQAHAMMECGLDLPTELLAISCSSHNGEDMHLDAVRDLLHRYDLAPEHLANTPDHPYGLHARESAIANGSAKSSMAQNCSGKHAAMLATCVVNGWPLDGYLDVDHPLQTLITAGIEKLTGESVSHIGLDGCGAPTHMLSVRGLANSYAALARGSVVFDAMRAAPSIVGGTDRDVTRWMQEFPGLMVKDAVAGVMAGADREGRAFAFKVADGSDAVRRAVGPAAVAAMTDSACTDAMGSIGYVPVLGNGEPVGEIMAMPWVRVLTTPV